MAAIDDEGTRQGLALYRGSAWAELVATPISAVVAVLTVDSMESVSVLFGLGTPVLGVAGVRTWWRARAQGRLLAQEDWRPVEVRHMSLYNWSAPAYLWRRQLFRLTEGGKTAVVSAQVVSHLRMWRSGLPKGGAAEVVGDLDGTVVLRKPGNSVAILARSGGRVRGWFWRQEFDDEDEDVDVR